MAEAISKSRLLGRNCVQVPGTEIGWLFNKGIYFSHVTRSVMGGGFHSLNGSSAQDAFRTELPLSFFLHHPLQLIVCPLVFKMAACGEEEGKMVKGKKWNQADCPSGSIPGSSVSL